ncbi:C-C motif chemokine 3-like [Arapaima gigas]
MKATCVVVLILSTLVSFTLSQNINGPEKCCFEFFKTRIPVKAVTHYEKTDERCPVDGVIFRTVKDRERCVDPSQLWVQHIIKKLDLPASTTTTKTQNQPEVFTTISPEN